MTDDDDAREDRAVRVAVALSRAVALSDELQATVTELAETLRSGDLAARYDPPSGAPKQ